MRRDEGIEITRFKDGEKWVLTWSKDRPYRDGDVELPTIGEFLHEALKFLNQLVEGLWKD